MRGKTLDALLDAFRSEIRASLNPAHHVQVRETQIKRLQQTQEWLYDSYNWPHLEITRTYPLSSGQRFYDFSTDFHIDRIESISVKVSGQWEKLCPGISNADY